MLSMKNKIALFLLLATAIVKVEGQSKMLLKDCIEYAIKNQPKMKNALLDEQMQIEKNNEIQDIILQFNSILEELKEKNERMKKRLEKLVSFFFLKRL
jgi:uncharacterized protein YccT (UPF0319 family)